MSCGVGFFVTSGVLSFYSIDSLESLWCKLVLKMVQAALTLVENPRYVIVENHYVISRLCKRSICLVCFILLLMFLSFKTNSAS